MSITPNWGQSFSPAAATRGSWTPLNMSTITAYPSSGEGKYAQLNYIVGMDSGSPGASSTNPTYVNVVNPVTLNGVISADLIEIENINVSSTVSAIPMLTNITTYELITLTSNSSSVITFSPKITLLEVFNDSDSNRAYLSFNTTTFANLTSQGLPILPSSYYSIEREVTQATIGSTASTSVRIIGHRRI